MVIKVCDVCKNFNSPAETLSLKLNEDEIYYQDVCGGCLIKALTLIKYRLPYDIALMIKKSLEFK